MSAWSIQSPAAVLLGGILLVAFVSVVTKTIILPLLGIDWPFRPVKAPWRFSLLSITLLVALAAVVLGLFRDFPDLALVGLAIVLVAWLTVIRYVAFRRALADRSHRQLAMMLPPKKNGKPQSRSVNGSR
jgi:hypothetical protein